MEILFTLSDSQYSLIVNATMANKVWEILWKHHQNKDVSNCLNLRAMLLGICKNDGETIHKYIIQFNDLINQINALSDPNDKIKDIDKALILMRGLPATYKVVITAMRQTGKLADYEHVTMSLINEEASLQDENNDAKAFYGQRGSQRGNQ